MSGAENPRLPFDGEGPSDLAAAPKGASLLQDIRDRLAVRNERLDADDPETLDLLAFCHQAVLLELRGCASSFSGPFYSGPTGERRWRDVLIGERGNLALKDVCRLAMSEDPRARAAARRLARHILTETEEEIAVAEPLAIVADIATAEGALIADLASQVREGGVDPAVILPDVARARHAIEEAEALVDAGLRGQLQVRRPVAAREARQ